MRNASTHLIAHAEFGSASQKFRSAIAWGIHIVSSEWLMQCVLAGRRLSEADFRVAPESAPSVVPSIWNVDLKRQRDESAPDVDVTVGDAGGFSRDNASHPPPADDGFFLEESQLDGVSQPLRVGHGF